MPTPHQPQALPYVFQVWMSEEIFLQTQISQFWPKHTFQSFQVVPMPCICQCHHRCNHPKNHWHYPMVCEFEGLNNYWQFPEAPTFCPEIRPAAISPPPPSPPPPPAKFVVNVGGVCHFSVCFKVLSDQLTGPNSRLLVIFLIFLLMCKPKFGEPAFSCEFGCAIFVHLTVWSSHMQSCRTHPTIGTTH